MDSYNSVIEKLLNISYDNLKNIIDLAIDDREQASEFLGIIFFLYYSNLNPIEKSNLISKLIFQLNQ